MFFGIADERNGIVNEEKLIAIMKFPGEFCMYLLFYAVEKIVYW